MSDCRLCGLETPDPPLSTADVDGEFCCRGCLEVATRLDDLADIEDHEDVPTGREAAANAVDDQGADGSTESVPDGAAVTYLSVDGMHCATCESFLALRGDDPDGVHEVRANYATGTARVVYDPDTIGERELPAALSGYGYVLRPREDGEPAESVEEAPRDTHRARGDRAPERIAIGVFLAMLVMPWYVLALYPSYLGVETTVLAIDTTTPAGYYVPAAFIAVATAALLATTGAPILRGAYVSLRTRQPNMDLLVSVAALSASAYSTLALVSGSTHLYYDVSVAIVLVVTIGRYYEDRVRSRATGLLERATADRVAEAERLTDTGRESVPVDALDPGDRVVVHAGDRVPVDGTVAEGIAEVDESVITGESLPVRVEPGDEVVGGATVLGGVEAEASSTEAAGDGTTESIVVTVGPEARSTADRLAAALWEVQTTTPGVQRFANALATVFVPVVVTLGVLVTGWRLLAGAPVEAALLAGLTVLVVSCPCAMGLATPLAIAGGLRDALERGVIVTDGSVLETARDAETIVFDKTGTLTAGSMRVRDVHGDPATLERAATIERRADHPVAEAILEAAETPESTGTAPHATDGGRAVGRSVEKRAVDRSVAAFHTHPGAGVSGRIEGSDGDRVVVGTPSLVERECGALPATLTEHVAAAENAGARPVAVGWDGDARGVIVVGDRERAGWTETLEAFADREVVVLTGDAGPRADRFRDHPAVDDVFAGVPPDGKLETIRRLSTQGTTAMVGDGTNDAPALAAADLGIAMGDGTARALEAADVVVTEEDLRAVETVFDLAAGTRRRVRENVAWALGYNAVAIPLAVVGALNPLFAALAMAASSAIVVTNSTRSVIAEDPTVEADEAVETD
ncbi:Cu2+-exporting ATPase [Halopenitus malekzadehii]|uniref:Cu2+-exporting ATPase n=1 Tax=Halopenitus malekzadehii TaxID=1267564 RepID=A0A1H6JNL1_9EURY|nr:heavy metal translocating P-type ATPase [Halopenitus malekzadehii]SEH63662.1 Cu2+-exporting ATPase [Halopenitus malekzadehii]